MEGGLGGRRDAGLRTDAPREPHRPAEVAHDGAAGGTWTPHAADAVIDRMIDEFDRPGRSGGAGFYDYVDGRRDRLWPGLREHFGRPDVAVPFEDLKERMLFVEAIESVKCLDEGVLTRVSDANIGSILGIGFPAWTGGVLRYIDSYPGGPAGFVARARELAARYGDRFTPPASLVARAERGEPYSSGSGSSRSST